jgi:hypothetical protein
MFSGANFKVINDGRRFNDVTKVRFYLHYDGTPTFCRMYFERSYLRRLVGFTKFLNFMDNHFLTHR